MVASSSLCDLPRDVLIEEILLRLPAKLLAQCKLVCKEWRGIISSPSFIDKHLNHHTNQTRLLIYYNKMNTKLGGPSTVRSCSLFLDFETLERHPVPDNLMLLAQITFFRGPCNGIFCIHITENRFALWNPTTQRIRPILCSPSFKFDEVGFGVDPLTGDFKIVLIRALPYVSPCFAIYTSSNDSWRYLEQEALGDSWSFIHTTTSDRYTFLNGTYYWILQQCGAGVSVLAFDMHTEIFEQIGAPEVIGAEMGGFLELFNNSLVLVSSKGSDMEIWLFEGLFEGHGYWTKILYVVLPFPCSYPYGFWGENKILLEFPGVDELDLAMYDLESHNAKLLDIERGPDECVFSCLPVHYRECLASVKEEHGSEDLDARSVEGLRFLGYVGPYTDISCHHHRAVTAAPLMGVNEQEDCWSHHHPRSGSINSDEDNYSFCRTICSNEDEDPYENYRYEGNLPLSEREENRRNIILTRSLSW